jgi:PKHD-type hydroxylase
MLGEWCYFQSYFTRQQCEDIIGKAKLLAKETARIGHEPQGTMNDVRRSKIAWINEHDKTFSEYYLEIDKIARWANKDWFDFHLSHLPALQFTEYDSSYSGMYKRHKDVFWVDKNPRHRKLSIVLNLSDPNEYEGGNFIMHDVQQHPPYEAIKKQGTVIVFPSMIDHEVTPVIKGIRHTLVGWYEGPKWR